VFAVLGLGCTQVHPVPTPNGPNRPPATPRVEPPPSATANSAPSPRDTKQPERDLAIAQSPFQLRLPTVETFLLQPLPPEDPARYSKWREQGKVEVGHGYLYGAHFLPGEGIVLVASGEEQAFRLYDNKTRRLLHTHHIPASEDFSAVAVPSTHGVFRVATSDGSTLFEVTNEPAHAMRWSPDGRILVALDSQVPQQTSTLRFFLRVDDGTVPLGTLSFDERVDGFALTRDNRLLAVSQYPSNTLKVLDLHTGETLLSTSTPNYVASVDFSPDGRSLAFGGESLVVLDLLNPERRAYYGHLYNNLNTVRFSPSGDAIVTSAYDGRLRVFLLSETTEPSTEDKTAWLMVLVKELRHQGHANVYGFDFRPDGSGLVSASGDRTVRWFGGRSDGAHPDPGEPSYFQSLESAHVTPTELTKRWAQDPSLGEPFRLDSISSVQPTHLPLGRYDCKITNLYRLSFSDGNLLPLDAIVYDDGKVTRLIGALREESSLYSCNGCTRQPIMGVLRGQNGRYTGLLLLKRYFDPHRAPRAPSPNEVIEEAQDRFPLTLEYRGPLVQTDTPEAVPARN
jgi:hypothetical protein